MSKTEVSGKQIKDGSIELVDLSSAVSNDITTLKSDVSNLQSDVSTLQGTVASSGYDLSGIDGRVGLLESDSTTKTYVDTQISNLVNGSPSTLNTLNELATALGSDANFSATVAAQIGSLTDDVSALDSRVAATEGDISTLQSDVANKASAASLATVATSGSYNDLADKPSLFSGSYTDLTSKPSLATVATSGAYSDLSGKPSLATVATSGAYSDLSGAPSLFSGSYTDLSDKPSLFSGSYTDLTNKPSLFSGSYTDLTNKPSLFSGSYIDLSDKPSLFDGAYSSLTGAPSLATVATSGSYTDLADKPSLFSGSYTDLTDKPSLFSGWYNDLADKPSLFSGSYTDLTNKPSLFDGAYSSLTGAPSLATVATSGSYTDLADKPSIPSLTGYATETYVDSAVADLVASAPSALNTLNELATALGNDANFSTTITNALAAKASTASLATVATSGSYADLSNKPTLGSFTTLTTPASGEFLKYNGSAWVNASLPVADANTAGIVSTSSQTFAGAKTFSSGGSTPITTSSSGGESATFNSSAGYNGIRVSTDGATGVPYLALNTNGSQKAYLAYWGDTANRISLGHSSSTDVINYFNGGTYSGRVGIQTITPGGQLAVTCAAATTKGFVVQGAASQTANLFETQNSAGTVLASISSAGAASFASTITAVGSIGFGISGSGMSLSASGYNGVALGRSTSAGESGLALGSYVSCGSNAMVIGWGGGGLGRSFNGLSTGEVGLGTASPGAQFHAVTKATTMKGLIVQGIASQTANLIEAQDSSGNAIYAVTPSDIQTTFNGITSKETNATVTTTDATETTLFSLTLADNTTYNLDVMVCARLSSTTAKGMYGRTRLMVYRNNAGSATIAADFGGQLEELDTYGSSGYDYVVDVSGNTVRVRVTGAASETVKWAANVKYVSVS